MSILPKGRSLTANSGTKAAVLLKGKSSTANSGTQVAVLLGTNGCGSFPLLSAPHSLFSIWTDLKRSEKIPGGTNAEVRRLYLANWALRTSPKSTTGVKYRFRQGFWPDQRSRNPNLPSPPILYIWYGIFIFYGKYFNLFKFIFVIAYESWIIETWNISLKQNQL